MKNKLLELLLRLRHVLLGQVLRSRENPKEKLARVEEEERLDRIRNPHKYRPVQDE